MPDKGRRKLYSVLQTNQGAVAWDYVLGVKRVIWPLSIFASAERLSSDEKSSVTNEGDEAAAVLDWVDIQLEARTQTVRRTRRDRDDEYESEDL